MLVKCGESIKIPEQCPVGVFDEYMEKIDALNRIEEKLNFNLLILGQALVEGIYCSTADGIKYAEGDEILIDTKKKCLHIYIGLIPLYRYFKDYNETWALTEEELKKANKRMGK